MRAFDYRDDVFERPLGAEIVDPHTTCLPAPIEALERFDSLRPGLHLGFWRNGVLQIEKDEVGLTPGRLRHHSLV